MFDTVSSPGNARLTALRAATVPVAGMVMGKRVEDVAELVPRLFSLCRGAQTLAVRRALGLAVPDEMLATLREEILRDHLFKLFVTWPQRFGMGATGLPEGWRSDPAGTARAVFGASGVAPETGAGFEAFLAGAEGCAPVLRRIDQCFAPGEAACGVLPAFSRANAWDGGAVENSVAARHLLHPALRHVAETRGRGPLWRAAARLYDIAACLQDRLPVPAVVGEGAVIVPATRGAYAVRATQEGGIVTGFERITPTDHLTAGGGVLEQMLARLPAAKAGLAELVLDIADPCAPVRLAEAR